MFKKNPKKTIHQMTSGCQNLKGHTFLKCFSLHGSAHQSQMNSQ
uniref:Uncharacterized protein n=1 Tax=Anguilla anguilla TaxID=7936 RepID=A0A0E9UB89_ANGAN